MRSFAANEMLILKIIDSGKGPIGSGTISYELSQRGDQISEATVGRILSRLDQQDLTEKIGYQGRVLTKKGKLALQHYAEDQRRSLKAHRFLKLTRFEQKEELINILVARRAIERETSRLAAQKASPEDLDFLQAIINRHLDNIKKGLGGAKEDVAFHKKIAAMSENKLLEAALDMIREEGQLSPVLEYIRQRVGSTIVDDHLAVLEGIAQQDAEKAEKAMTAHIEGIINDVEKYWSKVQQKDVERGES